MDFADGRSVEGYKHRLLLLLDEFPSLGRLDLFERALGFIGGYGLKSFIIAQGLPQLFKAYGKEEAIRVGCHIQIAFVPNGYGDGGLSQQIDRPDDSHQDQLQLNVAGWETLRREIQADLAAGGAEAAHDAGRVQEVSWIEEGLKRRRYDAGDMLIFPSGFSCIYGRQTLYFKDPKMDKRPKIQPPMESDRLIEIADLP
jgi:type IV secretion system protein VirD4